MSTLFLRLLIGCFLGVAAIWTAHEWLWIPYLSDADVERMDRQISVQAHALKKQVDAIPLEEIQSFVESYNQTGEHSLTLITETEEDWSQYYSLLLAEDHLKPFSVLADEFGFVISLTGSKSLLVGYPSEVLVEEQADYFWAFILLSLLVLALIIYWILRPYQRRIDHINTASQAFLQAGETTVLKVHGDDGLSITESRVNDLTQYLSTMTQQLEQSLEDQRDLLHAVAHEFRSPIARLRFAQEMALESDSPQPLIEDMEDAVDELDQLVSEVLSYSRLRHGGYKPNWESLPLEEVIEPALDKVKVLYPSRDFQVSTAGTAKAVIADQRMLSRALVNLIRNAARFARNKIHINCVYEADGYALHIADDGQGIPPGKRERIFEPFTRLDPSRSRDSGGIGLGLAIVQAASRLHGGDIEVHDSDLGGALFVMRWPYQPNQAQPAKSTQG